MKHGTPEYEPRALLTLTGAPKAKLKKRIVFIFILKGLQCSEGVKDISDNLALSEQTAQLECENTNVNTQLSAIWCSYLKRSCFCFL